MGNRIFKDQICRSKDLCRVSFFGESLFFHLILCCDDMGRFSADTRMIKGFAYPLWDHVTPEMIEEKWNAYVMDHEHPENNPDAPDVRVKGGGYCLWSDTPAAETEDEILEHIKPYIAAIGKKLQGK